ncbi:MAG: hypothetical protein ITG02_02235 [Patulibacter sp.]|nr:hypothetical protein [Patulibacter sp.]
MSQHPFINHVEMIHKPGEREAARAFFELLGFEVKDFGPWLVVEPNPENSNGLDNVMYVSEPIPAQQKFEDALAKAIANDPDTVAALDHYNEVRGKHPHYNFHFGVALRTREEWDKRLESAQREIETNPLLKGRVKIAPFNPGDFGSVGPQSQAFFLTDIVATGTLQTGLIFELQWTPRNEAGEIDQEALYAAATYLDPETLV